MLTKRPSSRLARSGVYGEIQSMTTPKCDICPTASECRFFQKGAKCKIKKAYYQSALNYFASLPNIRAEHSLMVEVYASEWFNRFWVTKYLYSQAIDGSRFERLDRVRDRSTKNMLKILSKFGLSPSDRTDKDLEEGELIEVLKDENGRGSKDKK